MSADRHVFEHFDDEAGAYAQRSAGWLWGPLRRRESRAVMRLLDPQPGERILDAGCGAGHYMSLIHERGADVVGADGSERMVETARDRGFDVHLHDLEASPPPGGPYDKILSAGALEFCPDPGRVVANLAQALHPGHGRLVLFVPRASLLGRLYRRHHRRHGLEIHLFTETDVRAWTPEGMRVDELQSVAFSWVGRWHFPVVSERAG